MPRVTKVQKARKDQGRCGKCRKPLEVGSAYLWWKFRYGSRYVRCMGPDCRPRPSDLTGSEFFGIVYAAREGIEDLFNKGETDLQALLDGFTDARDQVEEAAELRESAADAIEEHFEGSSKAEELREQGERAEEYRDALDDIITKIEDALGEGFPSDDYEDLDSLLEEIQDEASQAEPEF